MRSGRRWSGLRRVFALARWFKEDERGNILMLTALALPPLLATFGLGFEAASWYQGQRAMQNAADSAAVAAATNGGTSYINEARAVAAQYGFQNGVDGVTVNASNAANCPGGGSNCYSVVISQTMPLILSGMVGYSGDVVVNGTPYKRLTASATSKLDTAPRKYCILALAGSGAAQGIRTNGAPKADLGGCDVMSNSDAVCNGHNLKAGHGDAHGTSTGCGTTQTSKMPKVSDPYSGLASNIPADTCPTYHVAPSKKKDTALPASNLLGGAVSWSAAQKFCGDVQLTSDVTITTPASGVPLVIYNGDLDTNGFTIKTASGSAATIIFSGTTASTATHTPTGGGTLDIAAPKSGSWKGVAIYQDPKLTSGVDISEAGNSPTWKVTGLVYLPRSSVTFSGAVGKASNGLSCFAMVIDNLTINGTGSILNHGECEQAGLTQPTGQVPSRGKLVL